MQAEHSEWMKNLHTFLKHFLSHYCLLISQDLIQFFCLLNTRFSCNDWPDSALDRRLFVLQVLYFFGHYRQKLGGMEPINAVQEDCTVVVRDQKTVPSLQELLFQEVNHVTSHLRWNWRLLVVLGLTSQWCFFGLCTLLLLEISWWDTAALRTYSSLLRWWYS